MIVKQGVLRVGGFQCHAALQVGLREAFGALPERFFGVPGGYRDVFWKPHWTEIVLGASNSTRRAFPGLRTHANAILELKIGTSSQSYDNPMAPDCPERVRELLRREGEVWLRSLFQGRMWSCLRSSVDVVFECPRAALRNGLLA